MDYGDGSPVDSIVDGNHNYPFPGFSSYNVQLKTSFTGWTMASACTDTYQDVISEPNLKADFSLNINQGTVSFNNNTTDGIVYNWDFGDGTTDTSTSPTHSYKLPGNYTVILTAFNLGCVDSARAIIQIKTTGLDELEKRIANVYPNPANDILNIELSEDIPNESFTLEILSMTGQTMYSDLIVSNTQQSTQRVDVSGLPAGQYIVKLTNQQLEMVGRKVFVKR